MRAWLEIMRVSNLPTVVSNAIAGAAIGCIVRIVDDAGESGVGPLGIVYRTDPAAPSVAAVAAAIAAPSIAYIGGMVLNDAFDAAIDARERPMRPIPSGRIRRGQAFAVGFTLLAASVSAAAFAGMAALVATLALCAAIVVYNRFHARSAASTMLLAACRLLASLGPMLACADGDLETIIRRGAIVLPLALAAWTLGLSMVARSETRRTPRRAEGSGETLAPAHTPALILALTFVPAAGVLAIAIAFILCFTSAMLHDRSPAEPIATLPVFAAILGTSCIAFASRAQIAMRRNPARTPATIGTWIACLALLDAMALAFVGSASIALGCAGLFATTLLLQRRIAGS